MDLKNLTKEQLLERLPTTAGMRKAHESQSRAFVLESVKTWEGADNVTRRDILAFFKSDGPAKVADARRRLSSR